MRGIRRSDSAKADVREIAWIAKMRGVGWGEREQLAVHWRAALGLVAFTLMLTRPAGAADLNLLATTGASVNGANVGGQSISTTSLNQFLDVNYNRNVTPLLGYRLRVVGSGNESWLSSESAHTSGTYIYIEPIGEVILSGLRYSLDVGGRLRETFSEASRSPSIRLTDDYEYVRAFYTPDLLPALNFQIERTGQTDNLNPKGVDREGTRAIFGASYTMAQKLNLSYTFTNQTNDDSVTGRRQEQLSNVGNATYSDSFFGDRLSVDGSYFIEQFNTTEHFSLAPISGGAGVVPLLLLRAFSLIEDTPTVAANSKLPPATYATLTNSIGTSLTFTAPLIVNDGGFPDRNQSIAIGLSPGSTATTIRLTVSPRAGDIQDISQQAQGVTFQVFVGPNPQVNLTGWTQVPIVSVTLPTNLDPFFEITFAATSGSFLKVHVAGDTQQPALPPLTATAIAAFGPPVGRQGTGQISTGNLLQTLTGGLSVQPLQALTLSGNATYSTNQQDPTGRRDNNGTYSVTATGTPHPLLTATANYQNSFTDSNDPQTQSTDQWTGSLTLNSNPLPTLATSLSGSRTENSTGGVIQNRIDSISLNASLKPYRNLNTDVSASTVRGQNFLDGSTARQYSAVLNANALLTARLTGLFGYAFTLNEVTGGPAPSSATTNSTYLQLTYTISRLLNANARWDFSTTEGNYTLTQQYRLDLIPTYKTSVFLTFIRTDQSTSQVSGSTNTFAVNASWNISRYLDLNAFGSFTRTLTGDNVYTVSTTLSFRL
jgi:hypothetical protein